MRLPHPPSPTPHPTGAAEPFIVEAPVSVPWIDVSTYQIGAFEALEWAWHMLRSRRDPSGVEEATRDIQEVLSSMGSGANVDFRQKVMELRPDA